MVLENDRAKYSTALVSDNIGTAKQFITEESTIAKKDEVKKGSFNISTVCIDLEHMDNREGDEDSETTTSDAVLNTYDSDLHLNSLKEKLVHKKVPVANTGSNLPSSTVPDVIKISITSNQVKQEKEQLQVQNNNNIALNKGLSRNR